LLAADDINASGGNGIFEFIEPGNGCKSPGGVGVFNTPGGRGGIDDEVVNGGREDEGGVSIAGEALIRDAIGALAVVIGCVEGIIAGECIDEGGPDREFVGVIGPDEGTKLFSVDVFGIGDGAGTLLTSG